MSEWNFFLRNLLQDHVSLSVELFFLLFFFCIAEELTTKLKVFCLFLFTLFLLL